MIECPIRLEVNSPEATLANCMVGAVKLPGVCGAFEVLKNHAPLITALEKGNLGYLTEEGQWKWIKLSSGFAEVRNNKVTACVEM